MNTEPLAPHIDYEGYDGSHIQSGKELLDIDRQWSIPIYHLMGTFGWHQKRIKVRRLMIAENSADLTLVTPPL